MKSHFSVIAGQRQLVNLRLRSAAGAVCSGEGWRVYGGAVSAGFAPVEFEVRETADGWLVEVPGLHVGRPVWRYQIFVQDVASGTEWLVLSGEVQVHARMAAAEAPLEPGVTLAECVLSADRTELTVELGESTAAVMALEASASQSARDAATSASEAKASASAAQTAESNAAQSASEAKVSASAAQTAKSNAAQSASEAKASASAAQTAESNAAQSAALLGDAALKSGNNTFTGSNEFTSGIIGHIPCYAWLFSGCKSVAEIMEILPYAYKGGNYLCCEVSGLRNAAVWGDVAFYNEQFEVDFLDVYYFGKDFGQAFAIKPYKNKRLRVFAPFASGELRLLAYPYKGEKVEIYAPNCTLRGGYFGGSSGVTELTILAATQKGVLTGAGCWWYYTIKKLTLPLNKYKEIVFSNWVALEEVLPGFPHATKINFQKSKLNKVSVLGILNNLQTYDATTMETAPELTLGIDPTLDGDAEINEALLLAQTAVEDGGQGWNVAVSGFTITAGGGATMALRKPIFAQRWQDEDGGYIDANNIRWNIRYGNTVLENWVANEQLGYTEFATIEDALTEWRLTEYQPETTEEN